MKIRIGKCSNKDRLAVSTMYLPIVLKLKQQNKVTGEHPWHCTKKKKKWEAKTKMSNKVSKPNTSILTARKSGLSLKLTNKTSQKCRF